MRGVYARSIELHAPFRSARRLMIAYASQNNSEARLIERSSTPPVLAIVFGWPDVNSAFPDANTAQCASDGASAVRSASLIGPTNRSLYVCANKRSKFAIHAAHFAARGYNARWRSVARTLVRSRTLVHCRRSEEHTSELQSRLHLVCRLLL